MTGMQDGAPVGPSAAAATPNTVEGLWPQEQLDVSGLVVSLRDGESMPSSSSRTITLFAAGTGTLSCTITTGETGCTAPGPITVPTQLQLSLSTTYIESTTVGSPGTQDILFAYRVSP